MVLHNGVYGVMRQAAIGRNFPETEVLTKQAFCAGKKHQKQHEKTHSHTLVLVSDTILSIICQLFLPITAGCMFLTLVLVILTTVLFAFFVLA